MYTAKFGICIWGDLFDVPMLHRPVAYRRCPTFSNPFHWGATIPPVPMAATPVRPTPTEGDRYVTPPHTAAQQARNISYPYPLGDETRGGRDNGETRVERPGWKTGLLTVTAGSLVSSRAEQLPTRCDLVEGAPSKEPLKQDKTATVR